MSRLNFLEEQELAIQTVAEELAQLEKLVLRGTQIDPDLALLLDRCIRQAVDIQSTIRRRNTALSRAGRMQAAARPAPIPLIARKPEMAG